MLNTYRTIHDDQIATIGRSRYGDASHSSKKHQRRRWVLSIKIIVTMGALRKSNAQAVRSRLWCSDCFRWYPSKSDVKVTDQPTYQCDSIGYLHYCVCPSWTQNAIMSSDRQIASSNPTAVLLLILVIVLIHASHDSLRSSLLLNSYN